MHIEVSGKGCRTVEDVTRMLYRGKIDGIRIGGVQSRPIGESWTRSPKKLVGGRRGGQDSGIWAIGIPRGWQIAC